MDFEVVTSSKSVTAELDFFKAWPLEIEHQKLETLFLEIWNPIELVEC